MKKTFRFYCESRKKYLKSLNQNKNTNNNYTNNNSDDDNNLAKSI